ncbi:MAG: thiol reductase thioredoxin [Thiotrichales bacterium 16-46-22]|nr:MAG: thiol reductase thioredoxin [Thiotrichales bacterium 16-46-22]
MSDLVLHTSDSTFEQDIIKADEVAQEYTGKVVVAKLNIDENPAQPPKFGVRGIPTLMLLKGGQVVATRVGALSKSQLTDFLNSNLA